MNWRDSRWAFVGMILALAGCVAATRQIATPYQGQLEIMARQLTDEPFTILVVENSPRLAFINTRTRSITLNAAWTAKLMARNANLMRAVLAHEIAHVQAGHHNIRVEAGEVFAKLLQDLELEADRGAVELLHARGFNPRDYLLMMRLFKAIEDKNPSGAREQYYSSHPYAGDRLERVEKIIAGLTPESK